VDFTMMRLPVGVALVAVGILVCPLPAEAQTVGTGTLVLNVSFAPRSSLTVSTPRLRFDVAEDGTVGDAVVDYRVAARTRRDGGVLLTVASNGGVEAENGVSTTGLTVLCGADAGGPALSAGQSRIVARWRDSGLREGTIRCRLVGTAAPGRYSLPVTFAVVLD
jgi:hypothetical protein